MMVCYVQYSDSYLRFHIPDMTIINNSNKQIFKIFSIKIDIQKKKKEM